MCFSFKPFISLTRLGTVVSAVSEEQREVHKLNKHVYPPPSHQIHLCRQLRRPESVTRFSK